MTNQDIREAIEVRLKEELIVDQERLPANIAAALARLANVEDVADAPERPLRARGSGLTAAL